MVRGKIATGINNQGKGIAAPFSHKQDCGWVDA
jgi:hypothetical protein